MNIPTYPAGSPAAAGVLATLRLSIDWRSTLCATAMALSAFTLGVVPAHAASWVTKAPAPRGNAAGGVGAIGSTIYIAAGASGGAAPTTSQLLAYDTLSDTWSTRASASLSRSGGGSGVIGGKLYWAGGSINGDSNATVGSLEIYDPATDSWSAGAGMLTARNHPAAGVLGGKLYVAGGFSGSAGSLPSHTALEVYDPVANAWTSKAPLPVFVNHGAGAGFNGKFYVAGGMPPSFVANLPTNALYAYDPMTDTWSLKAPMPTARYGAAAVVLGGKLYLIGGASASSGQLDAVEAYDDATNSWTVEPALPTSRRYPHAAVVSGALYVIGGATALASNGSTVNEAWGATAPPPDTTPPTVHAISANPETLWPPNKRLVAVSVNVSATDDSGSPVTAQIIGVTCNEPAAGNDITIAGSLSVLLRATRLGSGVGRVYTVTVRCTDAAGNFTDANVTVTVPHDQR